MSTSMNHPYHLVTLSPWPILMSMSLMNMMFSLVMFMFLNSFLCFNLSNLNLFIVFMQWNRDIIRESMFQGFHTLSIYNFMKFCMLLFITSELLFFISFFWTYFHNSLSPGVEIGLIWPPKSIEQFNPYDIPLLNSIILISSGFSISWSHNCLLNNNYLNTKKSLILTVSLGIYFTMIQYLEYYDSLFSMNDSIFGSVFFMMTGFHGLHVIVGTLMLSVSVTRMNLKHFSSIHHFNFESSLWYWHFVDVIWLFLYIFLYWWSY